MTSPVHRDLASRLAAPGPKRILALDGGGIRGLITLGYLARLESLLRDRMDDPDLVLSDYFDLIGGTSTGALIAACLALGWPVDRVATLYRALGRDVFRPRRSLLGPLARLVGAKFDERPLERAIRREIGEMRLDDERFRAGLVVVAKRADTASVWQLTNVPGHRFFDMNRHMKVWEVLRASSAAPTYFKPQRMGDVGAGESAVFVDGGVSMHSNPALQMLMIASLEGFGLRWPLGEDRILLCSLGTGAFDLAPSADAMGGFRQIQWLGTLMVQLLGEASDLGETLLQWMSASPTARAIDRQIGDLGGDRLAPEPLLTYLRYDLRLTAEGLAEIGETVSGRGLDSLRALDAAENVERLDRIGRTAAATQIRHEHLAPGFDPAHRPTPGIVAVTGHRDDGLRPADDALLTARIDDVLRGLARRRYGVLLSGLAEGADRIVADRGLAAGWRLGALLPFEGDRYEEDFASASSRAEFRLLLNAAARVDVVEGAETPTTPDAPYAALGRALVERSSLVLAVWDGEPARGPGGTADVVAGALARGLPVVWIASWPPHAVRYAAGVDFPRPIERALRDEFSEPIDPMSAEVLDARLAGLPEPAVR